MSTISKEQLISFIDLTSLNDTDTVSTVKNLVELGNEGVNGILPAAICVHPTFAQFVTEHSSIPTAVVAGYFPSGQTILKAKQAEYQLLAETEVDEVDIVINRGLIFEKKYDSLKEEVKAARSILQNKRLKVILESGQLSDEQLRIASEIALDAGADFIKTSTGKSDVGATPHAAKIMCETILKHYQATGKMVGYKASGGIRNFQDAARQIQVVKNVLGEEWLVPELFRIGASSLYTNLKKEILSA